MIPQLWQINSVRGWVEEKVRLLVTESHLHNLHFKFVVDDWVKNHLIPKHKQEGVIQETPTQYDSAYFSTTKDLRNVAQQAIMQSRSSCFDQVHIRGHMGSNSGAGKKTHAIKCPFNCIPVPNKKPMFSSNLFNFAYMWIKQGSAGTHNNTITSKLWPAPRFDLMYESMQCLSCSGYTCQSEYQ